MGRVIVSYDAARGSGSGPRPQTGKIGQALEFDGVDDFIEVEDVLDFSSTDAKFTGSAWIRMASIPTFAGVITKWQTSPSERQWKFDFNNGMPQIGLSEDGSNSLQYRANDALSTGVWYHVVWSVNIETDTFDIYVNGAKVAASHVLGVTAITDIPDFNASIIIGARGGPADLFKGLIDDVRIYNRVLSADEINRLYKMGATAKINTTQTTDSLQKGLVGHWSFDGPALALGRAPDSSGNGNEGRLTDGPERTAGKIGQGMAFDGVDDYIQMSASASLNNLGPLTISAWIKADTAGANNTGTIYSTDGQTGSDGYYFHINGANLPLSFEIDAPSDLIRTSVDQVIQLGKWYHVATTWDGTITDALTVKIYVDGLETSYQTTTNGSGSFNDSANTKRIGVNVVTSTNRYFDGLLDDVRIYNRSLSADEIKRLYNNGATAKVGVAANTNSLQKGLVGYWTFDGKDMAGNSAAGEYAMDVSGNGNKGKLTNGPQTTVGRLGQGMEFDGVDDSIIIGSGAIDALDPGTQDFSISAWVKVSGVEANGMGGIFSKYADSSNSGCYLSIHGVSNSVRFRIRDTVAGGQTILQSGTFPIMDNNWHHVVVTVDRDGDARVYIDTVLDQAGDISGQSGTVERAIDARIGELAGNQTLDGVVDDVRYYHRLLTFDEIKRLYNMGR